ncbi:MAG: hypothetical protein KC619_14250 [Myxococcales bacterium]|nr:hypothetical protein [Myxococcales bacterium]
MTRAVLPSSLALCLVLGCSDPPTTVEDLDAGPSARSDAALDGGADAALDAAVDASIGDTSMVAVLDVREDFGVARTGEVARSGVPIPEALGITDATELRVTDGDDAPIPSQVRALARWGGDPDDEALPLQWVEVSALLDLDASATRELRLVRAARTGESPLLASEAATRIDTGAVVFELDPTSPALLVGATRDGAQLLGVSGGPRLVMGGETFTDVRDLSYEVLENGPLRAVVRQRGSFDAPPARCASGGGYDSVAYDLEATFVRGRGDVELRFSVRNECGDAFSGPWTDQAIEVEELAFEVALSDAPTALVWTAEGRAAQELAGSELFVAQRKGGGSPWRRRALASVDGVEVASAETFEGALAGAALPGGAVGVQLGFMPRREPQAIGVRDGRVVLAVVSERQRVGEAVGLWNHALLSFAGDAASLAAEAPAGRARLERGLLLHTELASLSRAAVMPPLRREGGSPVDTAYLRVLGDLHEQTVGTGGQWDRLHGYGSQLWPETVSDAWAEAATPAGHPASMNYWNPLGLELLEFVRGGDPEWAWALGLPAAWLQLHSAYYNVGLREHGNRGGFAVTSGGGGDGDWHRSADGSDDYSYSAGLRYAYLLRPEHAVLDRFLAAGETAVARYAEPPGSREDFVSARPMSRQFLQHVELLANCAQFVPGARGDACRDRLHDIVGELSRENLVSGVPCAADAPDPARCVTPQQFMLAAFMIELLVRYELTWPGRAPELRSQLVEIGRTYRRWGVPMRDGAIDPAGDFAAGLDCTFDGGSITSCVPAPDSDGNDYVYGPTRLPSLAMLLVSDQLDPERASCAELVTALDTPAAGMLLDEWSSGRGYWKGINQAMQNVIFAVGARGSCP